MNDFGQARSVAAKEEAIDAVSPRPQALSWEVYYRGSLSSCNYACGYCPFAKTANTRSELAQDRREVERFVAWVEGQPSSSMSILFTPWGEALGHRYYRRALVALSCFPQVRRVGIQTNLSAPLGDLAAACSATLALWATYHPGQVSRTRFVSRCQSLRQLGVRFSVGTVGMRENLDEIEALRAALWPDVYLWVNAYKRDPDYYHPAELARLRAVDPYFDLNNRRHPSRGLNCRAGHRHFTVDGRGDVRRCHFVGQVIGNLYDGSLKSALRPRPCPMESCGCYIGYIHLSSFSADQIYGEDRLSRIPAGYVYNQETPSAEAPGRPGPR